jgi:hypothetical protein
VYFGLLGKTTLQPALNSLKILILLEVIKKLVGSPTTLKVANKSMILVLLVNFFRSIEEPTETSSLGRIL